VVIAQALLLLMVGCRLPQVVIFEDPLTAEQHNELGYAYEQQGKYELAEKEYQLASHKKKDWFAPYFNLANVYYKLGESANAERYYRKALGRDENNPDIMNNLAYVLYEQGKLGEAEMWIQKALSIRTNEEYLDTQTKILQKKRTLE